MYESLYVFILKPSKIIGKVLKNIILTHDKYIVKKKFFK